jgi:predicted nucleic acid-binding protein
VNILVDTSIWSLALRRKAQDFSTTEKVLVGELTELVREGRARILGVVRQELLSGIKVPEQYERLLRTLRSFPDEVVETADYELAAKSSHECRSRGIAVSTVDALICAFSSTRDCPIFTTDPDFENYASVLPVQLHTPRKWLGHPAGYGD